MADCSFSLALCTENKCFPKLYYVLVGCEILRIPLSDTNKSNAKRKAKGLSIDYQVIIVIMVIINNYL